MPKNVLHLLEKNGYTLDNLTYFIGHQANMRIMANIAKQLNLPDEKFLHNIEELGNTGSVSSALVYAQNDKNFKKDDLIAITVFGGGYSTGNMKLLEGKVAVVTGAARGIGKAIALKFAQEGANIAFTDLVIDENGLATQAEIEALGVKAKGYASNAANFEETHNVVAEIVKDFGRIDILVNNAGITKDGLMMRMSEGQWDAVLNVNLKSAFNFIHACTPVMMKQRAGSIINMSSVVGVHGNAGQANYSASKAGMIGLAKSVAQELGSRGIRANAIAPGFIITDMTAQLSDEVRAEWCKKIPLRRGGTVEDVANIATFLASDMSSYVSGQVIQVDGGMNM